MTRFCGGGLVLSVLLFISAYSGAQSIRLISEKDGKPVREAIVLFTGHHQEQLTTISGNDGLVEIPVFPIKTILIQASGFKLFSDTLKGNPGAIYKLKSLEVDIGEVVITGQYHAGEAASSVYQVTVYDRKNIELRAANNLSDLLLHENSIFISRDPFLGAGVNINGISGNNVKILQDGVPVIGRENGSIDVSSLDLSQVERVELVRGPMSETYGSDALAGVINLITKKKNTDGVDAGIRLYYESVGTYNAHVHAALRKKKQECSLHMARNFFDGYSEFDTLRSKQWKPKEQYLLDAGYTLRFKTGYLRYLANVARESLISKGNITATPYEAYAFDDYYNTFRMSHKLFADKEFSNQASVNLTNAFSNYERSRLSYRKDMVSLKQSGIPSNEYVNLFRQFLFRGTYSTYRSWKKINYQVGYDITLDEARGDRTGSTTRRINDFAFFGSTEVSWIKKLLIRPAIRVIYNTKYPAPLVPSLQIKYQASGSLVLRASVARGFRAPSVKELYLDFEDSNHNLHGNTELKPELSDYAQLSLEWETRYKSIRFSLQPDLYFNHLYNKITLAQQDNSTLEYTYINLDNYRNYGGNVKVSVSWRSFKVSPGISITAYHNNLSAQEEIPGYNRSVNFNGSVSWTSSSKGLSAGLFFKHTGKTTVYSLEDEQINVYEIRDYTTVDCSVAKTFLSGSLRINAGVKNLLNVTTAGVNQDGGEVHNSEPGVALVGMGRYYFAGLNYTFGKN